MLGVGNPGRELGGGIDLHCAAHAAEGHVHHVVGAHSPSLAAPSAPASPCTLPRRQTSCPCPPGMCSLQRRADAEADQRSQAEALCWEAVQQLEAERARIAELQARCARSVCHRARSVTEPIRVLHPLCYWAPKLAAERPARRCQDWPMGCCLHCLAALTRTSKTSTVPACRRRSGERRRSGPPPRLACTSWSSSSGRSSAASRACRWAKLLLLTSQEEKSCDWSLRSFLGTSLSPALGVG